MISIIIPVYQVEQFLVRCLESVCNQTYRDLDIILIDDGSPDDSGKICDDFAARDSRIRVFHTENRSLSCARNLGIEKALATGSEYLAFVDSDDWLETEMYEKLYDLAQRTGADVTACGTIEEYANQSVPVSIKTCEYRAEDKCNVDALIALMNGQLREEVWNKLWKVNCFQAIRFPAKWNSQDIATVYLVIEQTKLVAATGWNGYHYNIRRDSACRKITPACLTYDWLAHYQRYSHFKDVTSMLVQEYEKEKILKTELKKCAYSICRYWSYVITFTKKEKSEYACHIKDICSFSNHYFPLLGEKSWPMKLRFMVFLTHYNSSLSFAIAYILNSIRRLMRKRVPN